MIRLILSLLLLIPAWSADLTGHWVATLNAGGREYPIHLDLKQSGGMITGAFGLSGDFLWPLRNARIDGNRLTFVLRLPEGLEAAFAGQMSADSGTGRLTSVVAALDGEVALKKVGPLSRMPSNLAPRAETNLGGLSDEFSSVDGHRWKLLSDAEGLPDRIERLDIGVTNTGAMTIVPHSAAWWAGYHGAFLFKQVRGDFVVTARLKVSARNGGEPANPWTMGGLLLRAPGDLNTSAQDRKENWIYLMTGRGPQQGRVVDAKSTRNSVNSWEITETRPGWHELRIARIGSVFLLASRPDGGEWGLRKIVTRDDLPNTLQVGINVTSDYKFSSSMPAARYNAEVFAGMSRIDALTVVDWVRFTPVPDRDEALAAVAGRPQLDLNENDLLRLFE